MYEDDYYREIEDAATLQEELPPKPYCSDDLKKGLRIRPRATALTKRYIQLNPPHQRVFLTFDLDYRTWAYVAEDVNLPQPIWCVGNTKNGHAHLIYALMYPGLHDECSAHEAVEVACGDRGSDETEAGSGPNVQRPNLEKSVEQRLAGVPDV